MKGEESKGDKVEWSSRVELEISGSKVVKREAEGQRAIACSERL